MEAHTPAPWKFEQFERAPEGCEAKLIGFRATADVGLGRPAVIAEAYPQPWLVAVNEANMRLIAAAPTLLAALKTADAALGILIRTARQDGNEDRVQFCARHREAVREAIDAAEGR